MLNNNLLWYVLKNCGKRATSGLTIPTTYSYGNTSFLWSFFPLFYLSELPQCPLFWQVHLSKSYYSMHPKEFGAFWCSSGSSHEVWAEKASDMVQNLPNGKCAFTPSARHKMSFWKHIWINQSMLGEFLWWIHSRMYPVSNTWEYKTLLYCDLCL